MAFERGSCNASNDDDRFRTTAAQWRWHRRLESEGIDADLEFDLSLSATVSLQSALSPSVLLIFYRFSVGSGRPPVISAQYFDQCAKILKFPSYNSRDELVLAGVELYRALWQLISLHSAQKDNTNWPSIEKIRKAQDRIYSKFLPISIWVISF